MLSNHQTEVIIVFTVAGERANNGPVNTMKIEWYSVYFSLKRKLNILKTGTIILFLFAKCGGFGKLVSLINLEFPLGTLLKN